MLVDFSIFSNMYLMHCIFLFHRLSISLIIAVKLVIINPFLLVFLITSLASIISPVTSFLHLLAPLYITSLSFFSCGILFPPLFRLYINNIKQKCQTKLDKNVQNI